MSFFVKLPSDDIKMNLPRLNICENTEFFSCACKKIILGKTKVCVAFSFFPLLAVTLLGKQFLFTVNFKIFTRNVPFLVTIDNKIVSIPFW